MSAHRVHPVAELFPLLDDGELQELADDIRAQGLSHPIVLHEGMVLDGRNRLRACELAGVEPRFVEWVAVGDPLDWVVSTNLHRRHLSTSQRALLAVEMVKHYEARARARMLAGVADPASLTDPGPHARSMGEAGTPVSESVAPSGAAEAATGTEQAAEVVDTASVAITASALSEAEARPPAFAPVTEAPSETAEPAPSCAADDAGAPPETDAAPPAMPGPAQPVAIQDRASVEVAEVAARRQAAEEKGRATDHAARRTHVSRGSVLRAEKVVALGTPELVEAVRAGGVTVNAALEVAKLPPEEQRAVVREGKRPQNSRAVPAHQERRRAVPAGSPAASGPLSLTAFKAAYRTGPKPGHRQPVDEVPRLQQIEVTTELVERAWKWIAAEWETDRRENMRFALEAAKHMNPLIREFRSRLREVVDRCRGESADADDELES